MATVTVDQSKLILNAFAATFQNNLISKDLCTWKQYDSEMDDRNGLKVVEQVVPRYVVNSTTNGVKDLTAGVQDSVFGSEQFVVNKTFNTSMGWADFVKIRDIGEARESEALKSAATQLAEQIDIYVMGVIMRASNNWPVVSAAGNGVDSFGDFVPGYTRLKAEGVDDNDLRAVLTYQDKEDLGENILSLAPMDSLAPSAFRQGFTGSIGGIPTMFTQQMPTLTSGSHAVSGANVKMNAATQNVNYSSVAVSTAPGYYMTQTINITVSAAGTETVKAGEVFTIAGVNAYDNRAQQSQGRLQEFVVIEDATAVAGAIAALRIFPAIIVPATGGGSTADVNSAHATVDSVPAAAALITFKTGASATYTPRFIIQKPAIVVNTADLIMPASDTSSRKQLTKVPLSVRMWQTSDFNTGAHAVRFDVALTANVRDRRRIVRISG